MVINRYMATFDRASLVGTAKKSDPASVTVTSASPAALTKESSVRAASPDCSAPPLRPDARSLRIPLATPLPTFTILSVPSPQEGHHDHAAQFRNL